MFKYASSKPSKKKIKGIYTGESEWAEIVSTRCFHLTTHSQLLLSGHDWIAQTGLAVPVPFKETVSGETAILLKLTHL
jgi:hypothetical protein